MSLEILMPKIPDGSYLDITKPMTIGFKLNLGDKILSESELSDFKKLIEGFRFELPKLDIEERNNMINEICKKIPKVNIGHKRNNRKRKHKKLNT